MCLGKWSSYVGNDFRMPRVIRQHVVPRIRCPAHSSAAIWLTQLQLVFIWINPLAVCCSCAGSIYFLVRCMIKVRFPGFSVKDVMMFICIWFKTWFHFAARQRCCFKQPTICRCGCCYTNIGDTTLFSNTSSSNCTANITCRRSQVCECMCVYMCVHMWMCVWRCV